MGLHYNWKYTSHDLENYSLVKYETLVYLQVTYGLPSSLSSQNAKTKTQ
jgi:hypothetical protein